MATSWVWYTSSLNIPERYDQLRKYLTMERTLSIKLPESVFQKVQHAATHTQRTIDDIIVNTINAAFVAPSDIPSELADELASMYYSKDETLWQALRPSINAKQHKRLQELNGLANERELTQSELEEQKVLLLAHHRSVLRRAQAIAILTLRGYTLSDERLLQTIL